MKLKTIVALIAAVIGIGGSAAAYQMAASPSSDVSPAAATTQPDKADAARAEVKVPRIVPAKHFVWAPCEAPAVLKGDRCVTEVVQTVTLPSTGGGTSGGDDSAPSHQGGGGGGHQDDGDDSGPSDPPGDDDDDHGDDDEDDEDEHDGGDNGGEHDD